MLGDAVFPAFSRRYAQVLATDLEPSEPWLTRLDARDLSACERAFAEFRPNLVVHLAANTDLEHCEKHPDDAWATNALSTENIALMCQKSGARMVYVSTAGIFDGTKEEYHDFDEPNPPGVYGRSKYYGEALVERRLTEYFVFRAGWMMGGGPRKDKKFINKIYRQLKAGSRELFVVTDKWGTPTYTHDFAESMLRVIQTGYFGLYNQGCGGRANRYEIAKRFVELLGLANEVRVTPVDSSHFEREYYAPRPRSEQLVNLKLDLRKINYMRHWTVCLEEYAAVFLRDLHGKV
jgi:dTDP-4-dehydrorhamnose reductase